MATLLIHYLADNMPSVVEFTRLKLTVREACGSKWLAARPLLARALIIDPRIQRGNESLLEFRAVESSHFKAFFLTNISVNENRRSFRVVH